MESEFEYLIIGAGISGAVVSHFLHQAGIKHLILEKSKGLGGRIASRRIGDSSFDHGVSEFSLDPEGKAIFEKIFNSQDYTLVGNQVRFKTPATNSIKRVLAGREIKKEAKVIRITKNDLFNVELESGEVLKAKNIVITAPAPQTLELANSFLSEQSIKSLKQVRYTKRIILFSSLSMKMKMMDDLFSELNFEKTDQEILSLSGAEGFDSVKKWRYEKVISGIPQDFISENGIHVIGDMFQGSQSTGVQAAVKSAERFLRKSFSPELAMLLDPVTNKE